MGFLDKVKAQAEQTLKQGQEKVDEVQAKRKADGLLRDLGAWYYAVHTGRDGGQGEGELARISAELKAHEAEHGPLGGRDDEPEPPTPPPAGGATVPTSPPPSAPPPAPAPGGAAPLPPVDVPPTPAAPPMPPPSSAPGSLPGGAAPEAP